MNTISIDEWINKCTLYVISIYLLKVIKCFDIGILAIF